MRNVVAAVLLTLIATPAYADEAALQLKESPGQDVTQANCATCHSLDYIRINAGFLSPDGWKAEVAKMRAAFGAPVDDATADEILHYLSANHAAPSG
jgi:mono/diheme cytochrome c family protein